MHVTTCISRNVQAFYIRLRIIFPQKPYSCFIILSYYHITQGRIQELKKGGGGTPSPKKADERGGVGGSDLFFLRFQKGGARAGCAPI